MKTFIAWMVAPVVLALFALGMFRAYQEQEHIDLVNEQRREFQEVLCQLSPSERVVFCKEGFVHEIGDSSFSCFVDEVDGIFISTDWSSRASSDTEEEALNCSG